VISALLVDDQADIRLLMQMVVDAANDGLCVVGSAADGAEAIETADRLDPSIVVLDQRMPGLSGVDTAREIRARRPNQRFVLCSAHLDDEVRRLAAEVGIDRCISKDDIFMLPDVLREVGGPCTCQH
jgi:DNA-binding NarL/FixJ family response regulator